MNKKINKGFTLIELLVVIAIIGVLSAVVLASLNTARSKGNDAAIKGNLSAIRTQAEIYYDDHNNSYGSQGWSMASANCTAGMFSDTNIKNALKGADDANGTGGVACAASGSSYVVAADLTTTANTYWCVDSVGKAKLENGAIPAGSVPSSCP